MAGARHASLQEEQVSVDVLQGMKVGTRGTPNVYSVLGSVLLFILLPSTENCGEGEVSTVGAFGIRKERMPCRGLISEGYDFHGVDAGAIAIRIW